MEKDVLPVTCHRVQCVTFASLASPFIRASVLSLLKKSHLKIHLSRVFIATGYLRPRIRNPEISVCLGFS